MVILVCHAISHVVISLFVAVYHCRRLNARCDVLYFACKAKLDDVLNSRCDVFCSGCMAKLEVVTVTGDRVNSP